MAEGTKIPPGGVVCPDCGGKPKEPQFKAVSPGNPKLGASFDCAKCEDKGWVWVTAR